MCQLPDDRFVQIDMVILFMKLFFVVVVVVVVAVFVVVAGKYAKSFGWKSILWVGYVSGSGD